MLEYADNIFIIASGPSALEVDLEALPSHGFTIGINDVVKRMPKCHAFFTLDGTYFSRDQDPFSPFKGHRFVALPLPQFQRLGISRYGGLVRLDRLNWPRLSERRGIIFAGVDGGTHSGYGALGLAYHLRPKRIFLIGFDMVPGSDSHWSRESNGRWTEEYCALCVQCYDTAIWQLKLAGISVHVVGIGSAITTFSKISSQEFTQCLKTLQS